MKTTEEIAQHLQEIITNIYLRPSNYGRSAAEVEVVLSIYHQTWAYVTERDNEYFGALSKAGEAANSGADSFSHAYCELHPDAQEHEILVFALKHWATIANRLGIPMPAEYPDPRRSFLPDAT